MELLISDITASVALDKAGEERVRNAFSPVRLHKKQPLLLAGDPLQHLYFVEKGLLRAYVTDGGGTEHILQFAPEGSWIPDNFHQESASSAMFNIDALEPAEVLAVTFGDYRCLLGELPQLEQYFRMVMQRRLRALHLRVVNYLTHFAQEKYKMFLDVYPDLVQRVPQHMIAAYLGIKPETLSRNRKSMAMRKKKNS